MWPARSKLIEHHIHYNAGDADVEPDGKRPAGDGAVAEELVLQAAAQGDDREYGDGDGEYGVGEEVLAELQKVCSLPVYSRPVP